MFLPDPQPKLYHRKLPWIKWVYAAYGQIVIYDERTGAQTWCREGDTDCMHQFAADHSGGGLGSLIHRAASALGISRCGACAKRQAALNAYTRRR